MAFKKDSDRKYEKIKAYKTLLNSERFELENELVFTEEDDAMIECKVGKIENIFSQYDIAKNRTINENFHNYLMQETEIIPSRYDLELKLYVEDDVTQESQELIKKAIKRHYSFMITSTNLKLQKNNLSSLLLYFGGIILLVLNVLAQSITTVLPLQETSLIGTWFFVWEATSKAFFDRSYIKRRRFNMLRLYKAKVVFIKVGN